MSLKFSQALGHLLTELTTQPLTIAAILRETGERGFSLLVGLLVLPFLLPMPPGLSGVMGTGCLLLGIQMVLGRKSPWLPKKIARIKFSPRFSRQLLQKLRQITVCLEKIVRRRWQSVTNHTYTWRTNGFCIAWLSILLMSPIPFTNPFPAMAILLLAVAMLEADGLLMCIGYLLTLVNTILFGFIVYALWQTPNLLPNFIK